MTEEMEATIKRLAFLVVPYLGFKCRPYSGFRHRIIFVWQVDVGPYLGASCMIVNIFECQIIAPCVYTQCSDY